MATEAAVEPHEFSSTVPAPWVVRAAWDEIPDVRSLDIAPADGSRPSFEPGQFSMLYVPGVGEVPISISGFSSDQKGLIYTVRNVGAVTAAICQMKEGDWLGVRGPLGTGWPMDLARERDVLLIAGGLGLAPLRAAVQEVIQNHETGNKNVVYGARTPMDILFREDLFQWAVSGDAEVRTTVDRGTPEWTGNVGVVTSIFGRASFDPENSLAFVCGPEVMMRFAALELMSLGVPDDRIFVSLERSMHCGIGLCGHCQLGPKFICTDGPVFAYSEIGDLMNARQL